MRRVRVIRRGLGEWIKTLEAEMTSYREFEGLGSGEKSILSYAKGRKDVLLISDEIEARVVAGGEGIPYTGTTGLIPFAHETGKILKEDAAGIVKRLAKGDFGMTVELYDWALERLK